MEVQDGWIACMLKDVLKGFLRSGIRRFLVACILRLSFVRISLSAGVEC